MRKKELIHFKQKEVDCLARSIIPTSEPLDLLRSARTSGPWMKELHHSDWSSAHLLQ